MLKAVSGAHEVITTIMLNYLAYQIVSYVLLRTGDWLPVNSQLQSTKPASPDARLPNMLSGTRLHAGLLLGLAMAVSSGTSSSVRRLGTNCARSASAKAPPRTPAWAGAPLSPWQCSSAVRSAGSAVRAKPSVLLGQQYNDPQGYGFASIAVGLVGRNNPFGVVLAALLFGTLRSGSTAMQNQAGTSKELVLVLQGLVILSFAALAASGRVQAWWAKRRGTRFEDYSDTIGVEPGVQPEL